LWRFASTRLARPLACRCHLGTALTLGLGLRLGLGLSALQRRLDRRQTVFAAGQLSGQCIASTAAQGALLCLILLLRLRHQRLDCFAQALHGLRHRALAHRLVSRGIARHLGASS
jgi:hypothetical protein